MAELFSRNDLHCNVVGEVDGHVDDEEVEQEVGCCHVLLGGFPGKEDAEGNVERLLLRFERRGVASRSGERERLGVRRGAG